MKSESGASVTSKACIQKGINRESHRIRRVYENWLKRDPSLGGQLTVRFLITASGAVTDVSVIKSSTQNSRFDENILRYIKRWDFSDCSIAESIEIIFPFAFSGTQ
jgi:TonB family protein